MSTDFDPINLIDQNAFKRALAERAVDKIHNDKFGNHSVELGLTFRKKIKVNRILLSIKINNLAFRICQIILNSTSLPLILYSGYLNSVTYYGHHFHINLHVKFINLGFVLHQNFLLNQSMRKCYRPKCYITKFLHFNRISILNSNLF